MTTYLIAAAVLGPPTFILVGWLLRGVIEANRTQVIEIQPGRITIPPGWTPEDVARVVDEHNISERQRWEIKGLRRQKADREARLIKLAMENKRLRDKETLVEI